MLQRNRELRRAVAATLVLALIAAVGVYITLRILPDHISTPNDDPSHITALIGATCALGCVALGCLPLVLVTRKRYRTLAQMAERLDAVLTGDRTVSFREMGEGELAVLSSELDKVIARLHLAVDELEQEKLALTGALADISHQLKTPLTSIALSTELVRTRLSEAGAPPEVLERVRLIQRLQGRVEDLVAALLKLARIDAGVIKLTCAPVDAAELVERAVEPLAIAFDIADVTLACDVQPDSSFTGDLTWSVEALGNVLKNCMEHTPAGGTVRVRVTEDVLACRIRVEDTGPGIAEADLPHIFERFYRGAGAANLPSEVSPAGVGIGLALAQSLVTAQGGTITAENTTDPDGHITGAAFNLIFFKTIV